MKKRVATRVMGMVLAGVWRRLRPRPRGEAAR